MKRGDPSLRFIVHVHLHGQPVSSPVI